MVIKVITDITEIDEMEFEDCDMHEANPDLGEDRILIEGPLYRLKDTDMIIAEGTYCNCNEDGELEPDFSVSLL